MIGPAKQTLGPDPREGIADYGTEMKDLMSRHQQLDSVWGKRLSVVDTPKVEQTWTGKKPSGQT
jgi:hypothetical protein